MAASAATVLPLDVFDLGVAALLVVVAGAVSLALRLRIERSLALASVRTVVQLVLLGYVLRWIFAVEQPILVVGLLALMVLAAGRAAVARSPRRLPAIQLDAWLSLALSATLTTFAVTGLIIGVDPWYRPQYVIPLAGMVLGNSLTGISLCLDTLLERLDDGRDEIEMALALGASRWEAARDVLAHGVRRGLVPIINQMSVVGIVSLPGMMTGQILAGSDPLDAVRYQIVVMFMIAACAALGAMLIALLVYRRLFNDRHQLLAHTIRRR